MLATSLTASPWGNEPPSISESGHKLHKSSYIASLMSSYGQLNLVTQRAASLSMGPLVWRRAILLATALGGVGEDVGEWGNVLGIGG